MERVSLHKKSTIAILIGLLLLTNNIITAQVANRQPLPFKIVNTSGFDDDSIFVAIVGEDMTGPPGIRIWIDCKTGEQRPMDRSLNTVPGPVYVWLGDPNEGGIPARNDTEGNRNPDGTAKYADCFTRLTDIPDQTVMLQPMQGTRVFISVGEQLYLFFHGPGPGDNSGYTAPSPTDPTDPNQGILFEMIELTYDQWGYFANTTRVDSYRYPIGMEVWGDDTTFVNPQLPRPELTDPSNIKEIGKYWKVGEIKTHEQIVNAFIDYAPEEFTGCLDEETGEIKAPSKTIEFADGTIGTMPVPGPYVDYLKPYIDAIWAKYANEDLYIYTGDAGFWKGRVQGDVLTLHSQSGEGGPFYGQSGVINGKPTTQMVLEGKGLLDNVVQDRTPDLMIQAQICAAINRHVVDITTPGAGLQDWSSPENYYQEGACNYYAKFWHRQDISLNSKSYGFCYDDVWDQSSSCPTIHPTKVIVSFGGYANENMDTIAPSAPGNLTALPSITSIELSWSASFDNVGVTGYNIYIDNELVGNTVATSYVVSELISNTDYTFCIEAIDASGNKSAKSEVSAKTLPCGDEISPSTPENLAVNPLQYYIELSWEASSDNLGVAGYKVFLDDVNIETTNSVNSTIGNLTPATLYNVKVIAFDECGNESNEASLNVSTLPIDDCSGTSNGQNGTSFDWSASSDTENPSIMFMPGEGVGNGLCILHYSVNNGPQENLTVTMNSPQEVTASNGQEVSFYYTYARAAGGEDNNNNNKASFVVGECGSVPCNDTEAPSAPDNFVVTPNSNSIDLSWTASTDNVGIAEYQINLGTDLVTTTTNTYVTITGLQPATTYEVTIVALDACGNSASTSVSTSTLPFGGCSGTSMGINGTTFNWDASSDNTNPDMTFISGEGVGTGLCILHYTVDNGAQQNVNVGMNEPYSIVANSGQEVEFYYTYAKAAGGEDHNMNDKASFIVGECSSIIDSVAPSKPANLQAIPAPVSIDLEWDASSDNVGVKGYNIYSGLNLVGTTTSTFYTVTDLESDVFYTFHVEAFDAANNISDKAQVSVTTIPGGNCSGTCSGLNGTSFDWEASSENTDPTITFIPGTGVGNGTCILHYIVDNGPQQNVNVGMSIPYQITANNGQVVEFYYTYSRAAGAEDNNMNDKATFTVGECESKLKSSNRTAGNNMDAVNTMSTDEVKVFPNPVRYSFSVQFNNNKKFEKLELINSNGAVIDEKEVINTYKTTLNISSLKSGIYFIRLTGGESFVMKKIIKE